MVSADCIDHPVMPASRYEQLVQSVVDYAIYMLDPTGHVVSWNAGAQRIKGYRAEEVIGRHFSLFFTPQDCAEGRPERLLKMALEQGVAQDEGWRVRKDGTQFWALAALDVIRDEQGQIIGLAKVTVISPTGANRRCSSTPCGPSCSRRRSSKRWASLLAAWRTTSTTC